MVLKMKVRTKMVMRMVMKMVSTTKAEKKPVSTKMVQRTMGQTRTVLRKRVSP